MLTVASNLEYIRVWYRNQSKFCALNIFTRSRSITELFPSGCLAALASITTSLCRVRPREYRGEHHAIPLCGMWIRSGKIWLIISERWWRTFEFLESNHESVWRRTFVIKGMDFLFTFRFAWWCHGEVSQCFYVEDRLAECQESPCVCGKLYNAPPYSYTTRSQRVVFVKTQARKQIRDCTNNQKLSRRSRVAMPRRSKQSIFWGITHDMQ